jgi:hypothetical protein
MVVCELVMKSLAEVKSGDKLYVYRNDETDKKWSHGRYHYGQIQYYAMTESKTL